MRSRPELGPEELAETFAELWKEYTSVPGWDAPCPTFHDSEVSFLERFKSFILQHTRLGPNYD